MASNSNSKIIKLQRALNSVGQRILYSTTQFYSAEQNRAVTKHIIKQAVWNEKTERYDAVHLFSSYSQLQVLLYLRDLWCQVTGQEIPTDNPIWEDIKKTQGLFQYSEEMRDDVNE